MIHRKTTKTLAETYHTVYSGIYAVNQYNTVNGHQFRINVDELYDFLYALDYPAWFLFLIKKIGHYDKRALIEFIMKLHTGESLYEVMKELNWGQIRKEGQQLLRRLSQDIIAWYESPDADRYDRDKAVKYIPTLRAELELDGYVYKGGRLYFSEANVFDEEEEAGILDGLIVETVLDHKDVMDHHLEMSETDYLGSRWDDSISNSRKFLESVLQEIADKYEFTRNGSHLDPKIYERPVNIRIYLKDNHLLSQEEVNAVQHVYGLLSDTGSHPYIAAKDQARLARNLALSLAQFVLLRFKGLP